jgi:methylphosphotriester-DNA--protein-cysteine methyltransferase
MATLFQPSARLAPFVRSIMVMEATEHSLHPVLPAPGLTLGIRYAGAAALLDEDGRATPLPSGGLVGMRTTLRRMQTFAGGGVVVAQFYPLGAAQFFDHPLHLFFGSIVPLADVSSPALLSEIEDRLASARSNEARAHLVDELLSRSLREREPDDLVRSAAEMIRRARGVVRIGALAKELGISQDPLEKRFRRVVGASPKQLASIARFREVVSGFERGEKLTALAHRAGYFDQSHLIREFRAFTGEAPEAFLRARKHC